MISRHSIFTPDPWGDGGARRSAQIGALLSTEFGDLPMFERHDCGKRGPGLSAIVRSTGFLRSCRLPLPVRIEPLARFGNDLNLLRRQLQGCSRGSLVLWESTQPRYLHLPFIAREAGVKVLALPHNLESLVPGNMSLSGRRVSPNWLSEEIRALAACDAVFTISREEQWLLRLHGIMANYLPYYPSPEVEHFMREIRCARDANDRQNDLLLLGTAANRPTLDGMLNRLEFFASKRGLFRTLHVVGFGTDRLQRLVSPHSGIKLHGAVDNQSLRALLLQVRAAIVHQTASSGALTRIPELLLAGVPVLANTDAARSYILQSGVHVYEDDAQLSVLLTSELGGAVPPAFPRDLTNRFLDHIRFLGGEPAD